MPAASLERGRQWPSGDIYIYIYIYICMLIVICIFVRVREGAGGRRGQSEVGAGAIGDALAGLPALQTSKSPSQQESDLLVL